MCWAKDDPEHNLQSAFEFSVSVANGFALSPRLENSVINYTLRVPEEDTLQRA
jgi:hypothetical protein